MWLSNIVDLVFIELINYCCLKCFGVVVVSGDRCGLIILVFELVIGVKCLVLMVW